MEKQTILFEEFVLYKLSLEVSLRVKKKTNNQPTN